MTIAPHRLFVYGTLAPGRPNEYILADLVGTWTPGSMRGHLVAEGWGAAAGYPGITLDDAGADVHGLVFDSADLADHWQRLDDFEGPGYERVLGAVRLTDGASTTAWVYAIRPLAEHPTE